MHVATLSVLFAVLWHVFFFLLGMSIVGPLVKKKSCFSGLSSRKICSSPYFFRRPQGKQKKSLYSQLSVMPVESATYARRLVSSNKGSSQVHVRSLAYFT